MKKFIVLALLLVPCVSFAADNATVRSNILAKLLDNFTMQVNNIDYIIAQTATANTPSEFATFRTLMQNQLSATTQQIATLLNPGSEVQFGSITPTTPQNVGVGTVEAVDLSGITIIKQTAVKDSSFTNAPNRTYYYFQVGVLNAAGKNVKLAEIRMSAQDNGDSLGNKVHETDTGNGTNWYTTFEYQPTSLGNKSITFTSGSFTKVVQVEVQ